MGFARDISARVSKARKYLFNAVRTARNFIYKYAAAIGSPKVNNLLKETSSVPTFASTVLNSVVAQISDPMYRTRLSNVSGMTSIFTKCSLLILCMNSSSESGKTCLLISFAFYTPRKMARKVAKIWLLSLIEGPCSTISVMYLDKSDFLL
jgi:hypothetical protein